MRLSPLLVWLIAAGAVVLLVLIARRAARPRKLLLAETSERPNSMSPIHWLALFLVTVVVGMGIQQAMLASGFTERNAQEHTVLSTQGQVLAALVTQPICIVLALLVAHRWFRFGVRRGLGLSTRHWIYDSLRGLVAVLAFLPVCYGILRLTQWVFTQFGYEQGYHFLLEDLPSLAPGWKLLVVLSAVPLTAVWEEVMYRGLLQSMVRRYVGAWPSILIASCVFGLLHANQPQAIPALIALAAVLGYNYERTGRLWASIVIHALFNLTMIADRLVTAA